MKFNFPEFLVTSEEKTKTKEYQDWFNLSALAFYMAGVHEEVWNQNFFQSAVRELDKQLEDAVRAYGNGVEFCSLYQKRQNYLANRPVRPGFDIDKHNESYDIKRWQCNESETQA